jgi:hypothetical protein
VKPKSKTSDVDTILTARHATYGAFKTHASITQSIKLQMHLTPNWVKLSDSQKEALEMIAHKIGRILNGDPNFHDSWIDISGYSKLVADELLGTIK